MERTRRAAIALVVVSVLGVVDFRTAHASQWLLNGSPVCTAQNNQQYTDITSDGQGGAIVVWSDTRSGQDFDIWAQRVDGWGRPVWQANGIPLCLANGDQYPPTVISDGAGGAIVVWEDYRTFSDVDLYAQRVDASGNVLWASNGVPVCTSSFNQQAPQLTSDGSGGAVITWHDGRGPNWDIYAQRVNGAGTAQWTNNGVDICAAAADQFRPVIAGDGAGYSIVAWEDSRTMFQYDIYAQRIDLTGSASWAANGVGVCTNGLSQTHAKIVSDDAGGAIITWMDFRAGVPDSYAQRINLSGNPRWVANGVNLTSTTGGEYDPQITRDGANGAIVAWYDTRGGLGDIYTQRINASGTPAWTATGVALCTAFDHQDDPHIVSDGVGGAIVSWRDVRDDPFGDVYVRRVSSSGVPQGAVADGTPTVLGLATQIGPRIAGDGAGGALVAWEDGRAGTRHIYAQRLDRWDNWGYASPDIVGARDVPGDQGGKVNVAWDACRFDPWPVQGIDYYTVWRAIDATLAAKFLASGTPLLDAGDPIDPGLTDGIRIEDTASQTYYWQLMATVDAFYLNGYAREVATQFDSTATTPEPHFFQVIAQGTVASQYWISAPATGRSLDNIAPASPFLLTAQRVGSDVQLEWSPSGVTAPDFQQYAVYRASTMGVQPLPGSFITGTPDTLLTDVNPPPGFLYYIVTAMDVHGNQSAPTNEAGVVIPTGVGDATPALGHLVLGSNLPNPFGASTVLMIGMPRASDVHLQVYDVAGRRVKEQVIRNLPAGWQRVSFDGRSGGGQRLPSGVYFYRVSAAGETATRKMVINR